jgi:hypothetical protein
VYAPQLCANTRVYLLPCTSVFLFLLSHRYVKSHRFEFAPLNGAPESLYGCGTVPRLPFDTRCEPWALLQCY